MTMTFRGNPDLFPDLEPEVTETAAAGLPLRGSQMDATMRGSDGSGKNDLFLSFSPSVSYRQHPSEVHARAAYGVNNFTGGQDSALAYPPKLQKRQNLSVSINIKMLICRKIAILRRKDQKVHMDQTNVRFLIGNFRLLLN